MEGVIERALALAPHCNSLKEVKDKLVQLGHSKAEVEAHLSGRAIRTQIVGLLPPSEVKRRVR